MASTSFQVISITRRIGSEGASYIEETGVEVSADMTVQELVDKTLTDPASSWTPDASDPTARTDRHLVIRGMRAPHELW
ncbi:hypothetical protein [Arthrobacter sp.]|uniref:hypothetical protein n=1 Tax=Arthrobacter sp. TaxID=1667 RepID=UPI003A8D4E5D